MKIRRLTVKNVGTFRGVRSFDLDQPVVVIFGRNFTGKSTLVRAIYFALTGKVLTTGMKPQLLTSVNEVSATVGIEYSHLGGRYRVFRSNKGDLLIEQHHDQVWSPLANNAAALPALNPQQWLISCFLKEEELGELLMHPPASRRDLLNQLLGVEQLLKVQDVFVRLRRMTKRREKTAIAQQASLRLDSARDCQADMEKCRNHVAHLEERLKLPQDADFRQRLRMEWEQLRDVLKARHASLLGELKSAQAGFASVKELRAMQQQIADRLADRDRQVQQATAQTEARIGLSERLRHAQQMLLAVQSLHGLETCPTCRQPLPASQVHRLEDDLKRQCDDLAAMLQNAERQEHEARETVRLLDQLAQRELDLRQRAARLQTLGEEIEEIQKQVEDLERKLSALPTVLNGNDSHEKLHRELQQGRANLSRLETQQALFEQHRRRIEEVNRNALHATRYRLMSEWITDALDHTVQHFTGVTLKQLEQSLTDCLTQFKLFEGRELIIDLEHSQLLPDIDGRAFQTLSGSEKAILYLGIKIAFSRMMPGADFLILDNPTLPLDDLRRNYLGDYLLSLTPEKQIILFTNDPVFANLMTQDKRINL